MNGRPFQIASLTVSPKPSRVDFCSTTSACDWNALTSIEPTLLKLLRMWMSGSPPAWAIVALKKSQPSGSSDAIEPTSASWAAGTFSFTIRYASMTPSGSFHGSNRETWQTSGRSTSMPNCWQTYDASSGDSAMFFGASGSIAGGTMFTVPFIPSGTYVATWNSDCGYSQMYGRSCSIVGGFGVDTSMWQRQTPAFALSAPSAHIAAGCGSCTMQTSHPPVSSREFISL